MHCKTKLLQIVRALHAPGGLACRLHGREQQRDQDGDDRDDHQELDQGKSSASDSIHLVFLWKGS
jgi:hypothetical protein